MVAILINFLPCSLAGFEARGREDSRVREESSKLKAAIRKKGLFPPKPSRRDVMVLMFGTQSVTFWYPRSFPNPVL